MSSQQVVPSLRVAPNKKRSGKASSSSRILGKKVGHPLDGQTKLKQFFKPKTNNDGYPMRFCRYHPILDTNVFCPPGYGIGHKHKQDVFMQHFCLDCMLSPCITKEYYNQAWDFSYQMTRHAAGTISNAVVRTETAVFLQKEHCKLFKKRYGKKKQIPGCIVRHTAKELLVYGCDNSDLDATGSDTSGSSDSEYYLG
jgi:hypothetical protein